MKIKRITIAAIILISGFIFAKAADNPIIQIFEKFAGKEGFTSVNITKDMFDLMGNFSDKDKNQKDVENIVSGLNEIKILTYSPEKVKSKQKFDFYNEIIKNVPVNSYTSLMDVNEENSIVKFLIKKEGKSGKISEFLMLVNENEGGTMIWITGELDLNKIKKLSKDLNFKGMDKLEKEDGK